MIIHVILKVLAHVKEIARYCSLRRHNNRIAPSPPHCSTTPFFTTLQRPSMANNPLDQLRPPLGTFTLEGHHPYKGGNPYSDDFRYNVITCYNLGMPLNSPELNFLRNQNPPAYPSLRTCERWINRYHRHGHFRPMRATDNHEAFRDIGGQSLVNLALFRLVHPEATISRTCLSF